MTHPPTPNVPYWHLWTDEHGVSRQTRCAMTAFEYRSMSPPAAPQWQGAKTREPATVFVTVQPVGWVGAWHENPKPQWIVPLSGRWFVESMDGQRVEMGPGELSFGEDQRTVADGDRQGHRSGTVGDQPAVLMIVQFEHPVVASPCPLPLSDPDVRDGVEIVDRRFAHYLLDNAHLETLATGFRWIEGLVWFGDANCVLFQDLPNDRTMRWIDGAGASIYRTPSHFANGQARDRQGRLVACSHRERCLYRTELDGRVTTLVDRHAGLRLNAPNDVVVRSDGSIWFTDPLYGISNDYEGGRQVSEQRPAVYRFDPATRDIRAMATDFDGPNGLAFSPDESRLYVAETGDQDHDDPVQVIRVFDVRSDGLALSGGDVFHKVAPGYCDGLRVDEGGNVWASAADGVHCIDPHGALLGRIFTPARVATLCFGGPALDRLFIGASDALQAIFLNRRGIAGP